MRYLAVMCVLALIVAGCGGPPPANVAPPRQSTAPTVDQEPVIATVLGKTITAKDIVVDENDKTALRDCWAISPLIVGPLVDKYVRDHQLKATADEIKAFRQYWFSVRDENGELLSKSPTAEESQQVDEIAKDSVVTWKFKKSLYERYKGRIEFQQAGLEPYDANLHWLEDEEKAGSFKIHDERWREAFWAYYTKVPHRFVEEQNAFEKPYWEAVPEGAKK